MKNRTLLWLAPTLAVLAAASIGGADSIFRSLMIDPATEKIVNANSFFEANKAKLNAAVTNRGTSVRINGSGTASNIVNSASATWTESGGVASITAVSPIWTGVLVADDDTPHAITVRKLGGIYTIDVGQSASDPGSYPSSVPMVADDLTTHTITIRLFDGVYTIDLSQ